jgi:hypothetical protein
MMVLSLRVVVRATARECLEEDHGPSRLLTASETLTVPVVRVGALPHWQPKVPLPVRVFRGLY